MYVILVDETFLLRLSIDKSTSNSPWHLQHANHKKTIFSFNINNNICIYIYNNYGKASSFNNMCIVMRRCNRHQVSPHIRKSNSRNSMSSRSPHLESEHIFPIIAPLLSPSETNPILTTTIFNGDSVCARYSCVAVLSYTAPCRLATHIIKRKSIEYE